MSRIKVLLQNTPVLRTSDLAEHGIRRIEISRGVAAGIIKRIARGVYSLPEFQWGEHGGLALVASRARKAVICLLSALRYHELTTQAPAEVWIGIANKSHPPSINYPVLRVVRFSPDMLDTGVELHRIDGIPVKITSIERTVADCFKFRSRVGLDTAIESLRDAVGQNLLNRDKLWRCAQLDRVTNVILPYLEAVG
jgi:predicted transcriptional regulator of viral defense system